MTRTTALNLIRQYSRIAARSASHSDVWPAPTREILEAAGGMADRFPAGGSERKAMRWLGYLQGVLVTVGIFTLEDVKHHSMTGHV